MAERRNTLDASSRGTTEIVSQQQERPSPPVPFTDQKIAVRSVFSSSVIIVITFTVLASFTTHINNLYIGKSFIPRCLLQEQVLLIQTHIDTFLNVQVFVGFVPAILADNYYVKKEWIVKTMMAIGAFSSAVLCFLATICAQYAYFKSIELKEDLFIVFIALQSMNEFAKPLLLALLLDQIVHLKDFTLDTSNIFSIVFLSKEFGRLITYCLAIYTTQSKTAAARTQIIPSILSQGSVYIFIFFTWWKYPLNSHRLDNNRVWKIIGCLLQRLVVFVVKIVLRFRTCRPVISYSDTTVRESIIFFNMLLILIVGLPFYYCLDLISKCRFVKRALSDVPQMEVIEKICNQAMKLGFLIFCQYFIFPLFYRTKMKKVLLSPMRRMVTCYALVGLCGLASLLIVCLHQRTHFELYVSKSSKFVSITNVFNDTIKVEFSMKARGWEVPIRLPPYKRHSVILEKSALLQMSVANKKLGVDDYYELTVKNNDDFVVCEFGLEKVEINESADKGNDKYISRIFVLCLLVICRGSLAVECNGRTSVVELYEFGAKHKLEVEKFSKCKVNHYNIAGALDEDNIEFEMTASQPVYYFAAVEDTNQDVAIKMLSQETKSSTMNLWLTVPFGLISEWASMVFEISYCQFILVESPLSCRTVIVTAMFTYQILAHICSRRFTIEDGLISEKNGFVFIAFYFVGFVWFLMRMSLFSTTEHIRDIYVRAQKDEF